MKGESAKRARLKELYYETQGCASCPLASSRRSLVFGAGNADARVVVVGEAPGAAEDAKGMPFVGKAGALLTNMLAAIGLNRTSDTFITNVLKCRPPDNRNPESAEIMHCMPILRRQIAVIRPQCILLLGRVAAGAVLERSEGVGALRGREHVYEGIPTFVTYHPAALLRNEQYKRPAWEDLKRLAAKLQERGRDGGDAA